MKDLDNNRQTIDWKKFGSIEPKRLSEDIRSNHSVLNELGAYIAFCAVDSEFETSKIDQNFVKLFKCSQVLIEYLLSEYNRFKFNENERKSYNNLIKENKKLRKLLEIQQKAMTYSRTFDGENAQCPHCPKIFFDAVFLKTHINRRHPNEALDSEGVMSLTNKIKEYQKFVIGDKESFDKLKNELKELTEKLAKTETNLNQEKDERIKLEKRMEYVLKSKEKELQQTIREELEEFKFVQREKNFEGSVDANDGTTEEDLTTKREIANNTQKSSEVQKIEEIMEIQANEMMKLGNSFQKLVSHLTESSDKRFGQTIKTKVNTTSNIPKPKIGHKFEIIQHKDEDVVETSEHSIAKKRQSKDTIRSPERTTEVNQNGLDFEIIANEIKDNVNEKFVSYGIANNSSGITEEEYSNALKKVSEERLLSIQQNRHDFDYQSIEEQIKSFVDKKVNERLGKTSDSNESIAPKPRERRRSIENNSTTEQKIPKPNQQSVEVIVHSSPINEIKASAPTQDSESESDSYEDSEGEEPSVVMAISPSVAPKSVLKPIINGKKSNDSELKAEKRRIRFSEHRTEYQISPEESSEDMSEEYPLNTDWSDSQSSANTPIPAQRTHKIDLTLDLKNSNTNIESIGRTKTDIDSMIEEIESEVNQTENRNPISERHTKVQELAQMIENQLNRRSAAQKKPPIGSVNVMSADNKPFVPSSNLDSDSD